MTPPNTQSGEDELTKIWGQPPCEVRDLDEFPELKHDERCLNCRFWEAVKVAADGLHPANYEGQRRVLSYQRQALQAIRLERGL